MEDAIRALLDLKRTGFMDADLKRVRAPIGLSIGGDTPGEIAISVVAKLVRVRRLGKRSGRRKAEGSADELRGLYKEATREEQKELLRLHVNQVVWKPQELCLELFNDPTDRLTTPGLVQSDVLSGSGGRTRTYDTVVNSHLLCRLSYAGSRFNSPKNLRQGPICVKGEDRISYLVNRKLMFDV